MNRFTGLTLGAVAGVLFIGGTLVLGLLLENYNSVSQTVSEIGRTGSEYGLYYSTMLIMVGSLSVAFAASLFRFSQKAQLSVAPAIMVGIFGLLDIGYAIFPSPHPLHNVVGLGHFLVYFSPLVLAITWRQSPNFNNITSTSWLAILLIAIGLTLNLSPLFAPDLYPLEYYGVVQRGLLYSYYGWLACLSLIVFYHIEHSRRSGAAI